MRIMSVRLVPACASDPGAFRLPLDFASPAVGVAHALACPFRSNSFDRLPLRVILPPCVSATVGVAHCEASLDKFAPCVELRSAPGLLPSCAVGVAHFCSAASLSCPRLCPGWLLPFQSFADVVGHKEEPEPTVRRSDSGRGKQIPLRIEPEVGQSAGNGVKPVSNNPGDVFQHDVARSHVANDSLNEGPEPAVVFFAEALSGLAARLAREARRDEIHASAQLSAIEGFEIVPDRRSIQGRVVHPRHESGRCVGVALDVTHTAVGVSEGELESKLEPSDAGT